MLIFLGKVTEFAEKGSVMTNSTLDEDTARRYFKDLINGLIYCMFMILNRGLFLLICVCSAFL
jgi:hypothetical protein